MQKLRHRTFRGHHPKTAHNEILDSRMIQFMLVLESNLKIDTTSQRCGGFWVAISSGTTGGWMQEEPNFPPASFTTMLHTLPTPPW